MGGQASNDLFGVYVHWPFCAAKCPYCDFNSHVREQINHQDWRDAMRAEIAYYAALTKGRRVTSIFFGGGTPSLMQPETVAQIIEDIRTQWGFDPDIEITLEANPTSVEADKFKAFAQAGVNRVSLGIQSLRDEDLRFLGRQHNVSEARKAIEIARENYNRYSVDLIYARPEQSLAAWREELTEALSEINGHISLYQLTIEQGTPFFTQHQRGDFIVPHADLAADFYELTQEIMEGVGLPAYEISNHARAGQESFHNMTYWQYRDYVGIGPGAHGRLSLPRAMMAGLTVADAGGDSAAGMNEAQEVDGRFKIATRAHRAPEIYLERVRKNGHGAHPFEIVEPAQRGIEALMMGLRMRQGVALDALSWETGRRWQDWLVPEKVEALIAEGDLVLTDTHLKPTQQGMERLNSVLGYLL